MAAAATSAAEVEPETADSAAETVAATETAGMRCH